jgi:GxxExxY protein
MTTSVRPEPSPELDECAHRVIGAAIEVHRALGPGFLESVYREAMIIELGTRVLHVEREVPVPVRYRGQQIALYRIDLIVDGDLVVELKAVEHLLPVHAAQTLAYLKAGGFQLGLVINFNVDRLRDGIRRVVWTG